MRRRWIVVPVVVGLMAIGLTGGAVMAQTDEDGGKSSPLQSLASRVASILGIDEAQVQDAFDQAATELRDEAMQSKLAALVENGRLTQEQSDEYLEWYQSRPADSFQRGIPGLRFGGGHHRHGRRGWGPGRFQPPATAPETPTGTSV